MLGILLSETIEVAYALIKYTYIGTINIYNWYYEIDDETKIKQLTDRIKKLELEVGK